jgi:hypothetical protein
MKIEERACARIAATLAIVVVTACTETKTGSNGTGAVPTGKFEALAVGTLLAVEPFSVGAAEIQAGTAPIRRNDDADAGAGALRLGMSFEGAGTVTGTLGTAPLVLRQASAADAVRGPVGSVDLASSRFTVAALTFTADANTLYDGVAGIAAIVPGSFVEVAGLPLAEAGTVLATRVTQVAGNAVLAIPARTNFAPATGTRVEIEGIALAVAASGSFVLRTPSRDYEVAAGAMPSPPVTPGARVRVLATATGPSALDPASVTVVTAPLTYRVTGVVSDFASLASLRVRGEPADLTTAVIRGGNASEIANGRRLAITGTAGPGALRVSEATLQ